MRSIVEHLVVVTHPEPLELIVQEIEHTSLPENSVALAYYHDGSLIARGVVSNDAVEAIHGLLARPVSLALAAAEDEKGNIEARICLVLPIDAEMLSEDRQEDEPEEPWRASVPSLPDGIESAGATASSDEEGQPRMALLPIGNVVRGRSDRHHPDDVAEDAREMLENLVVGQARDAVSKAIDDLLRSL